MALIPTSLLHGVITNIQYKTITLGILYTLNEYLFVHSCVRDSVDDNLN